MPESGALKVSNPLDEAGIAQLAAQAGNAANLLKVLGNERRLMIACLLMMRGEMPVGEIVAELRLSQSALSQHLARMRSAGIVRYRRSSQTLFYSIGDRNAVAVIALLKELYCKDL